MDLQELRTEIDSVDAQLLELFARRMQIVEQIARYKLAEGLPVYHPERERQVIERVRAQAGPGMADYAQGFVEALMAQSKRLQDKLILEAQRDSQ